MRKINYWFLFVLYFFVLGSCTSHEETTTVQPERIFGGSSCEKEREAIRSFDFEKEVSTVKVVWYGELDGRLNINTILGTVIRAKSFESIEVLEEEKISELYEILNNYTVAKIYSKRCYIPRHCLLWENEAKEVIAYLEICFECNSTISSSPTLDLVCQGQMDELEQFIERLE